MIHVAFPGAEVLQIGLTDLMNNRQTPEALAVCVLDGRLRDCGVDVPRVQLDGDAELLLYQALGERREPNPHTAMNAMLRRLDAYASASEASRHRVVPKAR